MKMDKRQIDLDNLDELIGKCEDSMISPFRKKKAEVEVELGPESAEEAIGAPEEDAPASDLEDMDLRDLISMYNELKDRE